jgi:pimeloyl-ACP methyl ester carboxylesterase
MSAKFALDLPVKNIGGIEHVQQCLQSTDVPPANYSFESDDETRIVYHVVGHGPELIVCPAPGWGIGIDYLASGLADLVAGNASQITLVLVQPRGTSPSERPSDESKMGSSHMADDLDALRRHLGQDKILVLGHSNGACIALHYAVKHVQHCHKAILISSQVPGYPNRAAHVESQLAERADDPRFAEAVKLFRTGWKSQDTLSSDEAYTQFVRGVLPLYFDDPDKGVPAFQATSSPANIQCWPTTKQSVVDRQPEASLMDKLHQITAKMVFFSGESDFICGVEASSMAVERIGNLARQVVYKECGHMVWIEKKHDFFRDMLGFLRE